jgi:hypothetical protein
MRHRIKVPPIFRDWELQEEESMTSKLMTQCELINEQDKGVMVTWIPQDLAKKGKRLRSLDQNSYGYFQVGETYTSMDEKEVFENSQDYRRTRKFSDI